MMMRSRRLVVGAMVAGLTVAALASPSLAAPKNNGNGNGNAKNGQSQPSGPCSYPPVSAPTVTLNSTASHVAINRRFTLFGSVDHNGCGLRNRGVALFTGPTATQLTFSQTGTTNDSGVFSFTIKQTATTYYQVASSQGGGLSAATSNVVAVTTP